MRSKMFTMEAIINSLQNILCDQASSLEYLIKDKLSESMNLRDQLVKSREELNEKEASINAFKKREKVLYKLIYIERCEKELLKDIFVIKITRQERKNFHVLFSDFYQRASEARTGAVRVALWLRV